MPAEQFESIPKEAKFYGIHFLSKKGGNIGRHFRKLCRIGKKKKKVNGVETQKSAWSLLQR